MSNTKISIPRNRIKKRLMHGKEYYYYTHYYNKQQKTFYGKTQSEVKEKFAKWVNKEENNWIEITDTFDKHFYSFIQFKKSEWKDNTYKSYYTTYTYIKKSNLAKIKLNELNETSISKFLNKLEIKFSSKKLILTQISYCLNYYIDRDIITKNLARKIKLVDNTIQEVEKNRYIDKELLDKIYRDVEGTEKELTIKLMGEMGLRLGEAMAITKKDIVNNNMLRINKNIIIGVDGKTKIVTPKNKYSIRTILIPDNLISLIKRTDKMISINRNSIYMFLKRKYNITCHDFRHTFTTNAVQKGVPISVLREYLGHGKASRTLEQYYLHLQQDYKNNEMMKLFNKGQ